MCRKRREEYSKYMIGRRAIYLPRAGRKRENPFVLLSATQHLFGGSFSLLD